MTNIRSRLTNEILEELKYSPITFFNGPLIGYIYGKSANLSAGAIAKAWAIWQTVETAFFILTNSLIENRNHRKLLYSVFIFITTSIGIYQSKKKNLIEEKMILALLVLRVFQVFLLVVEPVKFKNLKKTSE